MLDHQDLPEGTILVTQNQTQGRGQRGNTWLSEPGLNLTFSLLLKPAFLLARQQFQLSMAVALACQRCLTQLGVPALVKWPNDLMIAEQKAGGILIENTLRGNGIGASIVGIGLNVNQQRFVLPTATSVALATGRLHALDEVLELLCDTLEAEYLQLKQQRFDLKTRYESVLYWKGFQRTFCNAQGSRFAGIIEGVEDDGRLRVLVDGQPLFYDLKEITYVRED